MFHMLNGMTIRTKNYEISKLIIFSISVFMMNAKYFLVFIVSAIFAFINFSSNKERFPNSRKCWIPFGFVAFINASHAAINSFMRFGPKKIFPAMFASVSRFAFCFHCFIIALAGAILCFIASGRNMFKIISTNETFCSNKNSSLQSEATPRAKLRGISTIFWYVKFFSAMSANFNHRSILCH